MKEKVSDLYFTGCLYCDYPKKTASGTSFTEILAQPRGMSYYWLRNHINEKHPTKIKEFVNDCIQYLQKVTGDVR